VSLPAGATIAAMTRVVALAGLLIAVAGVQAAPVAASVAAADDACPGAHLKPECHLDEAPVCHCSKREGSSVTSCAWSCESKP